MQEEAMHVLFFALTKIGDRFRSEVPVEVAMWNGDPVWICGDSSYKADDGFPASNRGSAGRIRC